VRPRIVFTIFVKELVETLRDRRALFAALVLPVMVHPLILLFAGRVAASDQAERHALRPVIAIWGPVPAPVVTTLERELSATIFERSERVPDDTEREARRIIDGGHAHLVIAASAGARERFAGDESATLDLYFDELKSSSDAAHDRAVEALKTLRASELSARLARHQLPPLFDQPIALTHHELAGKQRRGGDLAGRMIAVVLFFAILVSGYLPAIDLTAGEKERGTLQTLLCAPVRPIEIVTGKYLTVVLFSLVGAAASLAAMAFALSRQVAAMREHLVFDLSAATYLKIFCALVPMALFVSALLLALAVFARSFREAQSYLQPIMLALVVPAGIASMPGMELGPSTAFVPVVNLALAVRALLAGQATAQLYGLVVLSNVLYATMAIVFAARVFETEQVLLGGERPWRDVFGRAGRARVTPSPRSALLFCAVLVVVTYYVVVYIGPYARGVLPALLMIQLGVFLVPAIVWTRASGCSLAATFSLRAPTARALAGALCIASGTWAVGTTIGRVLSWIAPGGLEAYGAQLEDLFRGGGVPVLVAGAVLPAIAEEACFRGVVLSGLANTGSRAAAIAGSAIAFGLFHLNPYHMVIAGSLGLVLGFATLESGSIFVGAIVHLVNNALGLGAAQWPSLARWMESRVGIAIGCASVLAGLVLVRNSRRD
jgi:sodium transport system permease protein